MRIGFFHDSAGTRRAGGVATYIQHMSVELAQSHDVFLYTQAGETAEVLRGTDVELVETPSFVDRTPGLLDRVSPLNTQDHAKLAMIRWSWRHGVLDHIDAECDVLVLNHFLDDLLLSHLTDTPTVYGFHSLTNTGIGGTVRKTFSRTEHVFASSRDAAARVADRYDIDVDAVVNPGVDLDTFHPGVEPALSSDDPVVLFVGRFVETKGIFDLLEAVARLSTPVQLRLVGRGDTDAVRARCRDLGLTDSVTIEGEVSHADLAGYYASADVFCLPSHSESFGMVNLEAMACGTPVVTTDLDAIEAYVTHGDNGLLASVGDPQDLAEKITTLLTSPDERRRLGERGRETAEEFAWAGQADRLASFCAEAADVSVPADSKNEAIDPPATAR